MNDTLLALISDLDRIIGTETVRARAVQLLSVRERLAALCARDPEN